MNSLSSSLQPKVTRAFTLTELLAVVVVMLIVLRFTLPSLDGLLGSDAEGMARPVNRGFESGSFDGLGAWDGCAIGVHASIWRYLVKR